MIKKILHFILIFCFIITETSFVMGQRKSSSRSVSNRRNSNISTPVITTPVNTQQTIQPETQQKNNIVGEKLSCKEKFNLCMDRGCLDQNKIRYNCLSSLDSFDKVLIDGEEIRIGPDLYTYVKGECASTLRECSLKEQNSIETAYKAQIQEDALTKNYFLAMNAASDETVEAVFQEYITCLAPFCGNMFTDCFTIKEVERRAPNCDKILSQTSKPLSVKKRLYQELSKLNRDLCSVSGGHVDYDTKKCKVKVSYGSMDIAETDRGMEVLGMSKEVKTMTFNIGEMVECTEEYFNTSNREKYDLVKGIIDVTAGSVKTIAGAVFFVGGVVAAAGGVVSTPFTAGAGTAAGAIAAQDAIRGSIGTILKGSGEILAGVAKIGDETRIPSGCFINGSFVAPMGTYFMVDFTQ